MLAVSGACAATVGLLFGGPAWALLAVCVIWGISIVADSAQFSTMVTELAHQAYVGTALTLQLAVGFTLTVATIWLQWVGGLEYLARTTRFTFDSTRIASSALAVTTLSAPARSP